MGQRKSGRKHRRRKSGRKTAKQRRSRKRRAVRTVVFIAAMIGLAVPFALHVFWHQLVVEWVLLFGVVGVGIFLTRNALKTGQF